jgi:hypothetical protein
MGYEVKIRDSSAVIPTEHKATILQIWKTLNHPRFDSKKRGGSCIAGKMVEKWYSWMTPDYDKTCRTVESVLDMLGFEYEVLANGDVVIIGYDSKKGQETVFFNAVAHLVTGQISWLGEGAGDFDDDYVWDFDAIVDPLYHPDLFDQLVLNGIVQPNQTIRHNTAQYLTHE